MSSSTSTLRTAWCGVLLLVPFASAWAQAPLLTGVVPLANALAAPRTAPLIVSFNQPLTAASAGALKVYGRQRGGLRTRAQTPATVAGSTLRFAPPAAAPFCAGETIDYTVTAAAAGSGGTLARARVGQFTTAVSGTGTNTFQYAVPNSCGYSPRDITTGDVDGDGDLDVLVANFGSNTVTVARNNGSGVFNILQQVSVPNASQLTVGDLDGDGDLDFVAPNSQADYVCVRLNNGNGTFSPATQVSLGMYPSSTALGDMDGDGDLDMVVTLNNAASRVMVCLNDGTGFFSSITSFAAGSNAQSVAVGDVDNDGDLDYVITSFVYNGGATYYLSVGFNDGSGTVFTPGPSVLNPNNAISMATGDLDGDGDLDVVTANSVSPNGVGVVNVFLNSGTGQFSVSSGFVLSSNATHVALGDVDGDGDLDLAASIGGYADGSGSYYGNSVRVGLNNGQGTFSQGQQVFSAGSRPSSVALADLDGDNDLDMAISNDLGNSYSTCTNQALLSTTSSSDAGFAIAPNPAHEAVGITGARANALVQVIDALGRVVLSARTNAAGAALLTRPAPLPPGLYIVRTGGQVRHLLID